MQKLLKQIDVKSTSNKSELKIFGSLSSQYLNKTMTVPKLGDHRICMSAVILSLITGVKTKIDNFETVNTSSPNFLKIIKFLGAKYEKN